MWTPGAVAPEDIKKHLTDKHQFEASDDLSPEELEKLHRKLHEEDAEKALV